ncbi:putative phosphatidate phosphatase [Zerene cesonia]|uniref:putative phosphatidate phosphatase n=1 Tax=Zerene cesonia TaxID=33412 RepID=UPI0018E4E5F0|nr:putative phosphatidate phosphatase [Zerene cesonia]
MARNSLVLKIVLDFLALIIVAFPLLAFELWASPYERGYFADDPSLRLPYKTQTISVGLLAGLGFALMVVTIITVEISRYVRGKSGGARSLGFCEVPGWIWESYVAIGVFTFGAACQQLAVTIAKYVIGRFRPHFFDTSSEICARNIS